jgi:hypothetical protein
MQDENEPAAARRPATGSDGMDEGNGELSGWPEYAPGEPGYEADAGPGGSFGAGPDDSASAGPGGSADAGPDDGAGAGPGTRPSTGEPRVDAALKLLDRLPGLPVSDHPELFEQVHAQLTEVLGELDSGPGGPPGLPG